jgi:uncharacterized membrane protein YphA (DoxX/SURF4 family)
MAKAKARAGFDATLILQIILAVFLVTLGIVGLAHWNSRAAEFARDVNRFFGQPNSPVGLIVAIAEIVAGVIIGLALLIPLERRVVWIATLVIAILWLIYILWALVFNNAVEPDFVSWLNILCADLLVLVCIWIVGRRYA